LRLNDNANFGKEKPVAATGATDQYSDTSHSSECLSSSKGIGGLVGLKGKILCIDTDEINK
jgi:hypothetical protein